MRGRCHGRLEDILGDAFAKMGSGSNSTAKIDTGTQWIPTAPINP